MLFRSADLVSGKVPVSAQVRGLTENPRQYLWGYEDGRGSQMCIRDRLLVGAVAADHRGVGEPLADEAAAVLDVYKRQESVSAFPAAASAFLAAPSQLTSKPKVWARW